MGANVCSRLFRECIQKWQVKLPACCSRSTILNCSTCSSTTNHLKPRWTKLLLCCRLTRLSKWLLQLLQLSPRRSKTRILNLKKKKKPNQTFFFFNSFTYARALVNDDELADN